MVRDLRIECHREFDAGYWVVHVTADVDGVYRSETYECPDAVLKAGVYQIIGRFEDRHCNQESL